MDIGAAIKARRQELKLSQRACAERMDRPLKNWQNWEYNIRTPNLPTLLKIAEALETTIDKLM